VPAAADEGEVTGILTGLTTVDAERTVVENTPDLAQYGLQDPRLDIAYTTSSGKKGRLLVGDKTTTLGDLYAKLPNDKKVILIAGTLDGTLNRNTFDLRKKDVLAFERDKVDAIDVQSPGNDIQLTRAAGEWTLVKPIQSPADYGSVEGLIGRIQGAQMKSIVVPDATDLKPYGLDKPQVTVTIGSGSSRASLLVGSKTDSGTYYAKDGSRPLIFTIDGPVADDLKKPADELRRKDLFAFRAFNATSVQLARGSDTRVFQKAKGQGKDAAEVWRQTAPAAKDVDAAAFDTMLTKLANLRAQSFVDPKAKTKTGLDAPALVVSVTFDDGKKQEKVTFGRTGSDVYASVAGLPGVAKVDTTEFEDAIKALDALK
jgi:hypothetical protein